MGLFDAFKRSDINAGVAEYKNTEKAFLIDVRSPEEYSGGHITSSVNVPLNNLNKISSVVKDKNATLFVYCYSGARSRQAVSQFVKMGYTDVRNIGGISGYKGAVE